ncbi:MAG: cryptochrome/photolyase family protein [Gammaproteobacteria bacterium]
MSTQAIIVWIRRDLRLTDNPALANALRSGRPVIPVFVLDDTKGRTPGGASRWWLHQSLAQFGESVQALGGQLILRRGETIHSLGRLIDETNASALYFSRHHGPDDVATEAALQKDLGDALELRRFGGRLLYEPEHVLKSDGTPYKVFTPFWKACQALPEHSPSLAAPDQWTGRVPNLTSDSLADWGLLPRSPDWAGGFRTAWQPGEAGALSAMDDFLNTRAAQYKIARDFPDRPGSSRLSAHLHFGEISPRLLWHAAKAAAVQQAEETGIEAFLRQLIWREFSYHLLFHHPQMAHEPLRQEFRLFPWRDDAQQLERWQQGRTGYPIVDAGMRELWATGWMHNRVRMIVASFLIKDLMIPWQSGEEWFWDTLVDADPANNAASWQWVAGCGTDSAPYFRIFNPSLQAKKFDPEGRYVRQWLPELKECPDKWLQTPWLSPDGAGIDPAYPKPIVDHGTARDRALRAYKDMRSQAA